MRTRIRIQTVFAAGKAAVKGCLVVAGLLGLFFAGVPDSWGAPQGSKEILARWGKKVITKQDLEAKIASLPPEYQMRVKTDEQVREFLEGIIHLDIIGAEARAKQIDKDKAVAARIGDTVNSILAQEYMKKVIANIKKPTEQDVEQYYQAHKGEFIHPAQVKAQHILIRLDAEAKPEAVAAAKAKAEGIRKELLAGGDFGKLAEKYSDDEGSKASGGDLGFFAKDKMIAEFADAAFSLKKDEISQPVKTEYGFHLIKVNEISPEKPMIRDEVVPLIQSSLENAKRQAAVEKELERLKKKYKVRITNKPAEK